MLLPALDGYALTRRLMISAWIHRHGLCQRQNGGRLPGLTIFQ